MPKLFLEELKAEVIKMVLEDKKSQNQIEAI